MNISSETIGRLLASGRGYAQYFTGMATMLGIFSAAQSKTITDSVNEIITGISQVVHGFTSIWQVGVVVLTPIVSVILAKWSSNTAKTSNQATAVQVAVKEANGNPATQLPVDVKAKIIDAAASLPEVKDNNSTIKVGDPILATAVPSSKVVA